MCPPRFDRIQSRLFSLLASGRVPKFVLVIHGLLVEMGAMFIGVGVVEMNTMGFESFAVVYFHQWWTLEVLVTL